MINILQKFRYILKKRRLILLAKGNDKRYPTIENIRPIITLSPIYKLIEIWLCLQIKEIVWKQVNNWQIGFRNEMETLINIYKLRKLIEEYNIGIYI